MRLENTLTVSASDQIQCKEKQPQYNRFMGIMPAFRHVVSGETHLSCDHKGSLAPVHREDALPERWFSYNMDKTECKLNKNIEKGYMVMGHFMNQNDAAHLLAH